MDKGTVIISVLTVVVLGGIIYFAGAGGASSPTIEGVQQFERTNRDHTHQQVAYQQTPPVGGAHTPTWIDCNAAAYENPVDTGKAVHALEHGAVWISYDPESVATSTVNRLQSYLDNYSFLSPVANQGAPIKLSAWGHQLAVEGASDQRIQEFLDTYRQGPQTPEPGASCNPPNNSMPADESSHHEHEDVSHYHDEGEEGHHQENEETSTSSATSSQE